MKVAVYHNNSDIRIEERQRPEISDGEILVKVKASGICGTDVMEWYRTQKGPRVLGHEISGEIVESQSDQFKSGQRVFVSHHVPCNDCKYCVDGNHTACETLHTGNFDPGGFSEFIRIPKINVDNGTYVLPEDVSDEEGTMIEPLACCIRAQRLIDVRKGQTVLVLGSGVSGILLIQIAKLKGAKVIATDVQESSLEKAKKFGADVVINAKEELNLKADRVIICAGASSAVKQAFDCVDKKGIISLFAVPNKPIDIPTVDFWRNELRIESSYGAAPIDLEESLMLIKDKKINVKDMITDKFSLEKIQEGFKTVTEVNDSLKVIIIP